MFHYILWCVNVIDDLSRGLVVKRATTPDEQRRLGREARVLRTVAHPGVVRLVGCEGDDPPAALLLERVGARPLRSVDSESSVMAVGVDVATTLADLHEIGWAHTAIRPEHVLVTAEDQAVLCGFGSCVRAAPGSRTQRHDVADLAQMLLDSLPPAGSQQLRRRLRSGRDSSRCDARRLARMLAINPGSRRRPWLAAAAVATAAAAAAAAVGLGVAPSHRPRQSVSCPAVDQGCHPVSGIAGPDRLMFSDPAVVVLGRWRCTGQAYPAVLDLRTGAVWMFAQLPRPGHAATARLVEQVAGAVSLSVVPGTSGCDRLVVTRRGRR
jgi:Lipopolysaccharide kinase (Kdo/WaaP) family